MVSFIKSKGTSFINKPVGVARVDTGSIQASEQLARTGQNLANSGIRAAPEEDACFLSMRKARVPLGSHLGGRNFWVHQKHARRSRNTSFPPRPRFCKVRVWVL